jgi:hypothetical protein
MLEKPQYIKLQASFSSHGDAACSVNVSSPGYKNNLYNAPQWLEKYLLKSHKIQQCYNNGSQ